MSTPEQVAAAVVSLPLLGRQIAEAERDPILLQRPPDLAPPARCPDPPDQRPAVRHGPRPSRQDPPRPRSRPSRGCRAAARAVRPTATRGSTSRTLLGGSRRRRDLGPRLRPAPSNSPRSGQPRLALPLLPGIPRSLLSLGFGATAGRDLARVGLLVQPAGRRALAGVGRRSL